MADPKDSSSFFRKVVKFVASPSTDWAELSASTSGGTESEFAKSALKAMIERKQRNDFVRKREFDMLRRVRREGLTSEQLATIGGSSRIDEGEERGDGANPDDVKAKIDEIEQQMVGGVLSGLGRRNSSFYSALTLPSKLDAPPPGSKIPVLGTRPGEIVATPSRPPNAIMRDPANRPSQASEFGAMPAPPPIVPARPRPKFDAPVLPTSSAVLPLDLAAQFPAKAAPEASAPRTPNRIPAATVAPLPNPATPSVPPPALVPAAKEAHQSKPRPAPAPGEVAQPVHAVPATGPFQGIFRPVPNNRQTDRPDADPPDVSAEAFFDAIEVPPPPWPPLPEEAPRAPTPPQGQATNAKASRASVVLPWLGASDSAFGRASGMEVSEVNNDPELDEAIIAFANADFEFCEQSLVGLIAPGGPRADHAESWLALFDLYRAIGEFVRFEELAMQYSSQFGLSSPQWFSMPQMLAESSASGDSEPVRGPVEKGVLGWVCPDYLDESSVAKLRSLSLQMSQPWVFDWVDLSGIEPQACGDLADIFRGWASQRLEMQWIGGERLFIVLAEACAAGGRDMDPVFWKLRFETLRMANHPDQFDEAAIDYCLTYEVSPPSWVPPKCKVQVSGSEQATGDHPLSVVGGISTSFVESQLSEDSELVEMASLELSGQLMGDISEVLAKLDSQLKSAPIVSVCCSKLIRVDFIAAGDLLNWVLKKQNENRSVIFTEVHRLIALFFGAMSIHEHATVKIRNI